MKKLLFLILVLLLAGSMVLAGCAETDDPENGIDDTRFPLLFQASNRPEESFRIRNL